MNATQHAPTKPLTVTVQRAKEITGLGESTLWDRMKTGTLAHTNVGGRRLIVYASLEKMLGLADAA